MKKEGGRFQDIADSYSAFVARDPIRNHLHYPFILQLSHPPPGSLVLDMGCGDGAFCRLIAVSCGTRVHGFDISETLIGIAEKHEDEAKLGIEYRICDPQTFRLDLAFNLVVAVMVLPYAVDGDSLLSFFRCAFSHLKPNGSFISVVFNPHFAEFDTLLANRRFSRLPNGKTEVRFVDPTHGKVAFTSVLTRFSQSEYEEAALKAGFKELAWSNPQPDPQGLKQYGASFWKDCIDTKPYALLTCRPDPQARRRDWDKSLTLPTD